jgi:hypothetical protein
MTTTKSWLSDVVRIGIIAGLTGGLAEIVWIGLYGALSGASVDLVAGEITRSIVPSYRASSLSAWLGIVIHLVLAAAIGVGLAFAIRLLLHRHDRLYAECSLVILTLVTVWALNFLVVLPYLNPRFVYLLPYSVTLTSKLLFGLSAATVFQIERIRLSVLSINAANGDDRVIPHITQTL